MLDRLKPLAKLNWIPLEKLHITTKFIGEWPEARLDEMKRALAAAATGGAIEIAIRGIGWFPDDRHPRVLWAGIAAGPGLAALARATADAAAAIGVEKEDRPYSPHLTLARIRERTPLDALKRALASFAAPAAADFGAFRAQNFYLYLSQGGRYTKLAEFAL